MIRLINFCCSISLTIEVNTHRPNKKGRERISVAVCPSLLADVHRHCIYWMLIAPSRVNYNRLLRKLRLWAVKLCHCAQLGSGKGRPHLFEYAQLTLHLGIQHLSNFLSNKTLYPMKSNSQCVNWIRKVFTYIHLFSILNCRLRVVSVFSQFHLTTFVCKEFKVTWLR